MLTDFVLVHGSWHGGWCWKQLSSSLRANGHDAHTPTLPGCAERFRPDDRTVTFSSHVNEISKLLFFQDLSKVILVGHSYAGMVIQAVANRVPDRIGALVYLDGYVVPPGRTGLDLWGAERAAEARRQMTGDRPFREPLAPGMLGITDPKTAEWMDRRLTPHPLATYDHEGEVESAEAARLPRVYLRCTQGPIAPYFAPIAEMVRGWGWPVEDHAWPHDAMMTQAGELAAVCIEYAKSLLKPAGVGGMNGFSEKEHSDGR